MSRNQGNIKSCGTQKPAEIPKIRLLIWLIPCAQDVVLAV
jgi:hypothetical protein